MEPQDRPLSPHLMIYRPQITSVLSILHRMTGFVLWVGSLALTYWLTSAVYGADAFNRVQAFLDSWLGRLMLFGWTVCLFYHLANGIRHVAWDFGLGFDMPTLRNTGWAVVAAALTLTALTWLVGYWVAGQ